MTASLTDRELLDRLVAFDSTSDNSNVPIADFICNYLEREGVEIVRNPSDDGSRVNVIAQTGPQTEGGSGLVLSGHMDVVPAVEPGWTSPPFELTERDGNLYARGASDMKGFLAVAMNALLRAASRNLSSPLVLLFTYDEETGTLGAKRFVETWHRPLPPATIIGEPTSLRVVHAHKGHLRIRLTTRGRSAHSGYPHLGKNAVEIAARAVEGLARLRRTLESERPEHSNLFPEVPFVPLNVGTIRGGTAVNIVPDKCEIEVGIRPLPGMETAMFVDRVREALSMPDEVEIEVMSDSPPMLLPPDDPLHTRLCGLVEQDRTHAVNYATDAGWFQKMGLDCVLFGPGSIEVAHRPDEFVPIEDLVRAASVLDQLIAPFT